MLNGSPSTSPQEKHITELNTWHNFKRLIRHAFPYRAASFFAIFCMLGYASIDVYFLSKLPALIDEGLSGKNPEFMKWAPLFVIVCFILRGTFHFLSNYCLAWVGNNVVADLRQKIFKHVMSMPVSFHDSTSTGTLISKLTFDTEQVLSAVSKSLLTLVQQGGFVIGLLFLMFWQSWQLSAIFLVITPIIAVIVTIVSKRFRKISKNIQNAMGEVTNAAEQTFNGHKVVITFDGQARENDRFFQINKQNRQQRMKMVTAKAASVPIIQVIASFALAFVLYVATLDGFIESYTPGVFMGVVTYMTMLLRPLKLLTNVNNEFQRGMAASSSIFELLDQQPEQETGDKELVKSQGRLTVSNISFAYPNEEKLTLDDISFHANTGETIALVGRSGSGKSTLTSLLLRFYQAQKGEIFIDGTDISTLTIKSLRRQFAYVSQQVVLFNDTLANNIAYAKPNASREEIIAAAKKAHVLEFAEKLPHGLDTNIGDNGALLSGGQRQRVAIARALLCDAPFLILDEATSALDTESERHIQEALTELQQQRTSIIIAHRLSTIETATNILVIDQGKVIEQGNHQALLAKDGAYAQLHKYQFAQ